MKKSRLKVKYFNNLPFIQNFTQLKNETPEDVVWLGGGVDIYSKDNKDNDDYISTNNITTNDSNTAKESNNSKESSNKIKNEETLVNYKESYALFKKKSGSSIKDNQTPNPNINNDNITNKIKKTDSEEELDKILNNYFNNSKKEEKKDEYTENNLDEEKENNDEMNVHKMLIELDMINKDDNIDEIGDLKVDDKDLDNTPDRNKNIDIRKSESINYIDIDLDNLCLPTTIQDDSYNNRDRNRIYEATFEDIGELIENENIEIGNGKTNKDKDNDNDEKDNENSKDSETKFLDIAHLEVIN